MKVGSIIGGAGFGALGYMVVPKIVPIQYRLLGGAAGFGIGWIVGNKVQKALSPAPGGLQVGLASTEATEILKANAKLPPEKQVRPSYSKQEFDAMARRLYQAMDGPGTDEDAVSEVMAKMNNDLDVLLLIEAFGVKDGDDLGTWLDEDGAVDDANKALQTRSGVSKRF